MASRKNESSPRDHALETARLRLQQAREQYLQAESDVLRLEQGFFRVVIFGSARIQPQDETYRMVYRIARALAERGIDIVTGGGPGLMEAANRGVLDVVQRESRSFGLPIDLPALNEPINRHLDVKSSHRRFSTRLDEFMRLSNAVVVAPGGIGTLLEMLYVWQLLQVGLTNDRPVILLKREVWGGLLQWMHTVLLGHGFISHSDFRWITLVDTEEEVIARIAQAHERFLHSMRTETLTPHDLDRTVTDEALAGPVPTELTEEGTE